MKATPRVRKIALIGQIRLSRAEVYYNNVVEQNTLKYRKNH
ncbi:hypothetical protein PAUR_a1281 [Pseudoalteromonas aurantia 208]|uniref:Uncharacterized protein n=1 Tax=Pseudoalteromonas aurantia 208 TaxID=1314867 RepID=A0ABR9EA26_9GAMM|nr:hypothetical protein [Pseudoalteromonas aurantia 208]